MPATIPTYSTRHSSILEMIQAAQAEHGDLVRLQVGRREVIALCHPDMAREVLIRQASSFSKLGFQGHQTGLHQVLGKGLLTNPERSSWRRQRRMIQPLFQQQGLARIRSAIIRARDQMITRWQALPSGSSLDMHREMLALGATIIIESIFSRSDITLDVPLSLATTSNKHARAARVRLEQQVIPRIQQRRQQTTRHDDILDSLLYAHDDKGEGLSDDEICDEILTLFAAGHETVANALTWALYLNTQVPDDESTFSIANLLLETLRLYPTIPIAPRVSLEEMSIAGFTIPRDIKVFISLFAIQRHADFWQHPDRFDLSRDFDKNPAFMPFGLGERSCVGRRLAQLQSELVLAAIIKQFRCEYLGPKPASIKTAVSISPRYGLPVRLWAR